MPFESRGLLTYVCSHVFRLERPVLLVVHEGGDWQFMCGGVDHGDDCHVVGVGHLVDLDVALHDCADMQDGYMAERSILGAPWLRKSVGEYI